VADLIAAEEGALKRGAQAVGEAKGGIDGQVKAVRSEIEAVGAYWTGEAKNAFVQMMFRWDEETRKLNDILVQLEDALSGTERDQIATEQSHQQTITGLQNMMA
jgi:WXG100 family type VII secretion target